MEVIVGIDLGTTFSAVGVVDSNFPILLADGNGRRIMPSAVRFSNHEVTVGWPAQNLPDSITSVKRLMGNVGDEDFLKKSGGRSPVEVSAEILKELKKLAEWRMGVEIKKAVITVPAYFHDGQRAATKRAGELAGLEVVRMLNEPTAAALAYGLDQLPERARIAVYDLGGGTFDLSILEMQDGVYQVLATNGDTRLGGDDFDAEIARRAMQRAGMPEGEKISAAWMQEAERVKRRLTTDEETVMRMPFYDGVKSWEGVIRREEMESWLEPWLMRSIQCCRRALVDSGLELNDLHKIVLVGGSTRMPCVRKCVTEFFGKEPDVSAHPDEAVALGAAIQAGMMSGAMRRTVLLDVTPLSLGIETLGGLMNVIIPRNTTIPCKAGEMFTNAVTGQQSMKVNILQGEREMARDNWSLGEVEISFPPMEKGRARIGVQFTLNESGMLEVLARDTITGKDHVLIIESSAVDVNDEAVEKMVGESVDHAFSDMSERVYTEARLKAEELPPAVDDALAEAGDILTDDEKMKIIDAKSRTLKAMDSSNANELKAAVQELDKATESLAAVIVERAMEKFISKS